VRRLARQLLWLLLPRLDFRHFPVMQILARAAAFSLLFDRLLVPLLFDPSNLNLNLNPEDSLLPWPLIGVGRGGVRGFAGRDAECHSGRRRAGGAAMLVPPATYQGGKARLAARIAAAIRLPPSVTFCDLCCGSGAVSLAMVEAGLPPDRLVCSTSEAGGKQHG